VEEHQRIKRLRSKFGELKIGGFFVYERDKTPVFIRYLTGAEVEGCLYVGEEISCLVTDGRFIEESRKAKVSKIIITPPDISYGKRLAQENIVEKEKRIGVESKISARDFILGFQRDWFPSFDLVLIGDLVEELASIKEKREIAKIKKAQQITELVFERHILPEIRPGITEKSLAAKISYWGKEYGAETDAFEPIVLSGPRSALPHGKPTCRKIKKGDLLQFDFGYFYQGYCSDFSRVVAVGKPTKKQKEIYQLVVEVLERAILASRPGIEGRVLNKIISDFLKEKGFQLLHSPGHGVGILPHTYPEFYVDSENILLPGQVFTLEPGIYLPGWGGIRIEDLILITKTGPQNLTQFPKDLRTLT